MFNAFNKSTIQSDVDDLNTQLHNNELLVSDNEDLQKFVKAYNELKQKYQALDIKHQIVTELNEIGTWDTEYVDGKINKDNKNTYNDIFRHSIGYTDEHDFPNVLDSWMNSVSEKDRGPISKAFEDHLYGDHSYDVEYRSITKDGKEQWSHARAYALKDEEGKVYRHIGTQMNIHQDKMNQERIQALLARLDLIEDVLKSSTGNIEGAWGITYVDNSTNVNDCWYSPQFKQLLGIEDTSSADLGFSGWLGLVHPEYRNDVSDALKRHIDHNDIFDMNVQMKTAEGTYQWFKVSIQTSRDSSGYPVLSSGILRDIQGDIERQNIDDQINQNMSDFNLSLQELVDNIHAVSAEANALAKENEKTVASVQQAKNSIKETQEVTKVIKTISNETNMLGLNAAIEAARAGDYGQGFSVVANEVQKLSDNSASAVNNVEDILGQVNDSVMDIVSSVDVIDDKIQRQANVTTQINQTTADINEKAKQLLELVQKL